MPKIFISPSTQEHNIGYGNYGTEEKQMNDIADIVIELLSQNGFDVLRNNKNNTLREVVNASNEYKPDAHIAIHSNASNGKSRGCEIWYYDGSHAGLILATKIYDELSVITPATDRGIKATKSLYELSHTTAPAVIIEVSFHDNKEDADWIIANKYNIAKAITKGICKYFGVSYNSHVYRICVGDWHDKTKADKALEDIQKLGYSAWLTKIN